MSSNIDAGTAVVAAPVATATAAVDVTLVPVAAESAAAVLPAVPDFVEIGGNKVPLADVQAAMESQKAFAEFSASLKTKGGLQKAIAESGMDAEEFAAEIILEALRQEEMTPEQRELETFRAKDASEKASKSARDAAEKAAAEAKTKAESDAAVADIVAKLDGEISAALASENLPHSEAVVQDIVFVMKEASEQLQIELSAVQAAQIVSARHYESLRPAFEKMTAEQLLSVLPEAAIKAIQAHGQAALKASIADPEAGKFAIREPRNSGPATKRSGLDGELDRLLGWGSKKR